MLRDEVSRHYYYLQLKTNAVSRDQPKECADQAMLLLGGLALQADIGDVPTNTTGSNKIHTIETASESCSSSSASAVPSTSSSSLPPAIAPRIPLADYFRVEDYIPHFMRSTWGTAAIQSCHREYRGMSSADAETQYIREACQLSDCINAHVFRMKQSKGDASPGHMLLIVYSKGIKVVPMDNGQDATTFLWPSITKLSFERKKFEIRSGEDRVTLYSLSDDKNKMLLALCRETHQFSMKIAPRLTEAIKRAAEQEEEEETSSIHTQYMYSRSLHLLPYNHKAKNDQRISVISSTSSNTTSGIISDRVHSEDELEIMINSPPVAPVAAPSTESLALAHLLDRPSVSRQTSCAGELLRESDLEGVHENSIAEEKSPLKEGKDDSRCSHSSNTGEQSQSSPQSMHNQGSQSSSTCSTVVIATATAEEEEEDDSLTENGNNRRQLSTSSSLELGYSHTAQNSSLSEAPSNCLNDTLEGEEDEDANDMSGVYTLAHAAPPTETSGVYTMNSSEMTGQNSEIAESVSESHESSHYGCFQPMMERHGEDNDDDDTASATGERECNSNRDSVDGKFMPRLADVHQVDGEDAFRLRSDSTISAAGSFRGDGSDPTDKKHGLLSAEELTELIVGRGTYPNRKTVSNNLDCDCDYVTLPLPLEGDSYIQGHQDTAPTEEAFDEEGAAIMNSGGAVQSPPPPPAPPKRIDSVSALRSIQNNQEVVVQAAPPPPPYNARHETTGLCGPPVKLPTPLPVTTTVPLESSVSPAVEDVPVLPLRDPPPYPQQPQGIRYANTQVTGVVMQNPVPSVAPHIQVPPPPASSTTTTTSLPEEAAARFIKTRPNINILKAHTSVVGEKPSFAAPTLPQHSSHHQQQHSQHTQMAIAVSSPTPSSNGCNGMQTITSTIGIPLMPYKIHKAHQSMSALHPNSYLDSKSAPRTCVLLPVIKPRQFLPPPPPTLPRQPPPPPPSAATHGLATVYTSQLARSQIELYQQQLYSDVDYVIYPLQDPAVSQQEYLDAKQGSILAAMAAHNHNGGSHSHSHPPPYMAAAYHHQYPAAGKTHALYRSTPFLPIQMPLSARYASTQNLSDTYVQLPGTYSPMYSPSMASLCSSYCEPPPPLPPIRPHSMGPGNFCRSRSDDNILNSIETMPRMKRMPPPPPPKVMKNPPYETRKIHKPPIPTPMEEEEQQQQQQNQQIQSRLVPPPVPAKTFLQGNGTMGNKGREVLAGKVSASRSGQGQGQGPTPVTIGNGTVTAQQAVDIQLIRERSKNLDLPLIAALCNDRSLLKQTKAFVMPKHPQKGGGGQTVVVNGNGGVAVVSSTGGGGVGVGVGVGNIGTMGENLKGSLNNLVPIGNRNKYPVSGLSTLQLAKPKKSVASHRHPQDKLPPLPGHTTEAGLIKTNGGNNYVMDPIKHKGYNSQPGV